MFKIGDVVKSKTGTLRHCFEVVEVSKSGKRMALKPLFPALVLKRGNRYYSVSWATWKNNNANDYEKVNIDNRTEALKRKQAAIALAKAA